MINQSRQHIVTHLSYWQYITRKAFSFLTPIDKSLHLPYCREAIRRRVEQLAARRAHNPKVVGPSPTPAK